MKPLLWLQCFVDLYLTLSKLTCCVREVTTGGHTLQRKDLGRHSSKTPGGAQFVLISLIKRAQLRNALKTPFVCLF